MNHKSRTVFESNYISKQIRYDVQGAFMKTPSKETLFKAASRLSSQIDPRRPTELSEEQIEQVKCSPAIRGLIVERDQEGDSARREQLRRRIGTEIKQAKKRLLTQVQEQYDEEAPVRDIERQRAGLPEIPIPVSTVVHEHSEQARIAELVQVAQDSEGSAEFTNLLAALCKRRTKSRGLPTRRAPVGQRELSSEYAKPMQCGCRCLFCFFDSSLTKEQREKSYPHPGNIKRHVLTQHVKGYEEGELECPDPACGSVVLRTRQLLQRHMDLAHGVRLREKQRERQKLKAMARK